MVSHTSSPEARARAAKKYYEKNREKYNMASRKSYYKSLAEQKDTKKNRTRQQIYEEGAIKFVRLLFL